MTRAIIKIKDLYFLWSTTIAAPITEGMSKETLEEAVLGLQGEDAYHRLPQTLEVVDRVGHSFYPWLNASESVEEFIAGNRAGKKEQELTANEVYEEYK